jgi:hypothetical protein
VVHLFIGKIPSPPPSPHSLGGILVDFYFWEREYEKKRKGLKSRCEKREGKMKEKLKQKG